MEYRSFTSELEIRSASKRLLCGIMVPFGMDKRVNESLIERFQRGSFTHQLRAAHRVRLLSLHSYDPGHMQLGHAVELRETDAGLWGEFRVVDSPMGDHYLALAREQSVHDWSVGFMSEQQRYDGRTTVHVRATVFETALVPEGAYGELAGVAAMRAAVIPKLTRDELLARLPKPTFPR